jgi:hypothetical protein
VRPRAKEGDPKAAPRFPISTRRICDALPIRSIAGLQPRALAAQGRDRRCGVRSGNRGPCPPTRFGRPGRFAERHGRSEKALDQLVSWLDDRRT